MSSLETSSYVLRSAEALLEDVAHLEYEKKWKRMITAFVNGLAVTPDPSLRHSQERMPHSVTDVSYGFHVHTVVMQRLGVRCRTCFCQEDAKPPSEIL